MNTTIRRASRDDIDWMIGQLKKFSEFVGSKHSLFDDETFARTSLADMINKHLVLVADQEEHGPVGFIGGLMMPHFFNPKIRVLAEVFWWVDESHRLSRAGLMLLNAFTEFGRQNCDWITMGIEARSPINDKSILKRGYRLQERSFIMEV